MSMAHKLSVEVSPKVEENICYCKPPQAAEKEACGTQRSLLKAPTTLPANLRDASPPVI